MFLLLGFGMADLGFGHQPGEIHGTLCKPCDLNAPRDGSLELRNRLHNTNYKFALLQPRAVQPWTPARLFGSLIRWGEPGWGESPWYQLNKGMTTELNLQ